MFSRYSTGTEKKKKPKTKQCSHLPCLSEQPGSEARLMRCIIQGIFFIENTRCNQMMTWWAPCCCCCCCTNQWGRHTDSTVWGSILYIDILQLACDEAPTAETQGDFEFWLLLKTPGSNTVRLLMKSSSILLTVGKVLLRVKEQRKI